MLFATSEVLTKLAPATVAPENDEKSSGGGGKFVSDMYHYFFSYALGSFLRDFVFLA